jgi:hypothetical protein
VAAYREQTVEIALGPNGAFQTGIVGALKRRVTPEQTVNALSAKARNRKPPKTPKAPKTPRVIELLKTAQEWRRQLDAGDVTSQAEIARREGVTRARVTQVMGLLRLAPDLQESILELEAVDGVGLVSERALRDVIRIECWASQREAWKRLSEAKTRADCPSGTRQQFG